MFNLYMWQAVLSFFSVVIVSSLKWFAPADMCLEHMHYKIVAIVVALTRRSVEIQPQFASRLRKFTRPLLPSFENTKPFSVIWSSVISNRFHTFSVASQVVGATSRALHNKDNLPVEDYLKDILEALDEFEAELANRGTTFFGGKLQLRVTVR